MTNTVEKFQGYWALDKENSDGDEENFRLIRAGMLLRQGVKALRGVEIDLVPNDYFKFAIVTILPFFKITEKYPLSGEEVVQKRRDMRGGKHLGKAKWSSGSKEIQLDFRFEGEIAGTGRDTFKLISDEELHVVSTLETSDGKNTMTKIYKRKKKSDNATN